MSGKWRTEFLDEDRRRDRHQEVGAKKPNAPIVPASLSSSRTSVPGPTERSISDRQTSAGAAVMVREEGIGQ